MIHPYFLLNILSVVAPVTGRLVAGCVIPHGDFAFDPTLLPAGSLERTAADEVATAARLAGQWLGTVVDPDVIILSTPHGLEVSGDFVLYLNSFGSGHVMIGNDLHNKNISYKVKSPQYSLAPGLAQELIDTVETNMTGLLSFADSEDAALRWGEVIPLHFISQRCCPGVPPRKHIIWSHPTRRYELSGANMVPELLEVGSKVARWAESRPERIAIVVSSDLAHTHLINGPYGYSNASAPFDHAVGEWAKDPVNGADELLRQARNLVKDALSCGYTGLVMLHGALYLNSSRHVRSKLLANRNATYYGMMVATFEPETEQAIATTR